MWCAKQNPPFHLIYRNTTTPKRKFLICHEFAGFFIDWKILSSFSPNCQHVSHFTALQFITVTTQVDLKAIINWLSQESNLTQSSIHTNSPKYGMFPILIYKSYPKKAFIEFKSKSFGNMHENRVIYLIHVSWWSFDIYVQCWIELFSNPSS